MRDMQHQITPVTHPDHHPVCGRKQVVPEQRARTPLSGNCMSGESVEGLLIKSQGF